MTPPMFALYVTCLLLGTVADTTALKSSSSLHFVSANVGDNVTLECFYEESAEVMFYWYKQTVGQKPELVSKFYKHNKDANLNGEFKNNPRFKVETTPGTNHLKILKVQISDSGTYYCISAYSFVYTFTEGFIVHVKDSGLNVLDSVHQSTTKTIEPGGSVTLNCTVQTGSCDGERSVYWFKNSKESHPGLIYSHGGRNDQCERNTNTQTHTCFYNLPMKSLNLSHAGTYYCAVASCGHILFGDGTKLDINDNEDSLLLVNFLGGALVFSTIVAVFLAHIVCRMYKKNSCQCKEPDSQARTSAASAPNTENCQDDDSLHYAALQKNTANRRTKPRDNTRSECVYSSVRQ